MVKTQIQLPEDLYRRAKQFAAMRHPLSAAEAVKVLALYRHHPRWKLLGFTTHSQSLHDELFQVMAHDGIAYRRIYDTRTALTLRHHGVTEFATTNVKNFKGFHFVRIWNPIECM